MTEVLSGDKFLKVCVTCPIWRDKRKLEEFIQLVLAARYREVSTPVFEYSEILRPI